MSRKRNLSPAASLATCLDFAARVLSSTASVQEVCTKSVLAPMVVEAHRYGQQVMKHLEPSTSVDVRKLLSALQADKVKQICRESPLIHLDAADLTWDFEGSAADTLEMELKELEDRAATATDRCVVFSTSSQVSGTGQAVIWFPQRKNNEDLRVEDDKKRRYILLYVCPGRVKVIKYVGDLIAKMYEEVPALREKGATYNVWAVVMNSKRSNQHEKQSGAKELVQSREDSSNQCEPESALKPSTSPVNAVPVAPSFRVSKQRRSSSLSIESRRSRTEETNQDVENDVSESTKEPVEASCGRSGNGIKNRNVTQDDSLSDVGNEGESDEDKTEDDDGMLHEGVNEESDDRVLVRTGDDGSGKIPDNAGKLSRSVDEHASHQLRKRILAKYAKSTDDTPSSPSFIATFAHEHNSNQAENETQASSDPPQSHIKTRRRLSIEGVATKIDDENLAVEKANGKREMVGSSQTNKPDSEPGESYADSIGLCEQSRKLSRSADEEILHLLRKRIMGKLAKSTGDNPGSPSLTTTFAREFNCNQAEIETQASGQRCGDPLQSKIGKPRSLSSNDDDDNKVDDQNPTNEKENGKHAPSQTNKPDSEDTIDLSGHSGSPTANKMDLSVQKPKPSAINYKDKLGARVWWELEYTARRLEREEILERQQQADRQRHNQVKREQKSTGEYCTAPRRFERTGLPKNNRSSTRKEVSIVTDAIVSDGHQDTNSSVALDPVQKQACSAEISTSSSLIEESRSLNVGITHSHDHHSIGNPELKEAPDKSLSPSGTSNGKGNGGLIHNEGIKQVETALLPTETIRSKKIPTAASVSASRGAPELDAAPVACPTPRTVPVTSPSLVKAPRGQSLDESLDERRLPTMVSTSKHAVLSQPSTSSFMQTPDPVEPESKMTSDQVEDEDETMAQMMWGSTHTSYERNRNSISHTASKEDEPHKATSALPFNVRGRVPVRTRRSPRRDIVPTAIEPSTYSSTENSPSSRPSSSESGDNKPPIIGLHRNSTRLQTKSVKPTPPPVATFIGLGEDNSADQAATGAKTRQDRLNELRQKKLLKLQQTRDMSIQQQKEKQQRQVQRPLSFSNTVYSKKASNRQLMQNALEFTLLAGGSMEKERELALQALAESTCDNFIVLLKSAKELKFRALYENHVERDSATRIFSVLPSNSARAPLKLENSEMISQFFKYSSAKKQFLPVPTRSFTVKTDACALVDQLVFKKNTTSAIARLL